MTKTIRYWILYNTEHYGRLYRIRIFKEGEDETVYYWWNKIPEEILDLPAKRVWCRFYKEEHGIQERELEIMY